MAGRMHKSRCHQHRNHLYHSILSCLLILLLMLWGPCPARAETVVLTTAEQAYLNSHPVITYCADPDWEPFEVITADGQHVGIAADLLRLAAERAGVRLQLVVTRSWDETLAASKSGRCTLLSFLNQSPAREQWLTFTDPLFIDSNVFITREEHPFITDPHALSGESIVLPYGTSIEERMRSDYPNIGMITVNDEKTAIEMVDARQAAMTMRSLIIAAYTIRAQGYFNLKIAGQVPNYENRLRIGVAKDQTILRDILNKGIASITPVEREAIINRFVSINIEPGIDSAMVIRIVAIAGGLLLLVLFYALHHRALAIRLRQAARTDALTGLANRTHLNELFPSEIARAHSTGKPLSVILLDIDHFKAVNDQFGHLAGDQVIIGVATLIRQSLRASDLAVRWGGEELLLLCRDTPPHAALSLAERVRRAVEQHPFGAPPHVTVSLGVASLWPNEQEDSLLQRADDALYHSKRSGRNRVSIDNGDHAGSASNSL